MMNRRVFTVSSLLAVPGIGPAFAQANPPAALRASHEAWVLATIEQMSTVKLGMMRADVLKVFQAQGGISVPGRQTFVSRACSYFKIDIEFRVTAGAGSNPGDVIVRMSKPYLDRAVMID